MLSPQPSPLSPEPNGQAGNLLNNPSVLSREEILKNLNRERDSLFASDAQDILPALRHMRGLLREEDGKLHGPYFDINILPTIEGLTLVMSDGERLIIGKYLGGGGEGLVYKATIGEENIPVAIKLCWPVDSGIPGRCPYSWDISQADTLYRFITERPSIFPAGTGFSKLLYTGKILHEPNAEFFTGYRVTELITGIDLASAVKVLITQEVGDCAPINALMKQTMRICKYLADTYSIKASDLGLNNFMLGTTASYPSEKTIFLPDLGKCEQSELPDVGCVARELLKNWNPYLRLAQNAWGAFYGSEDLHCTLACLNDSRLE